MNREKRERLKKLTLLDQNSKMISDKYERIKRAKRRRFKTYLSHFVEKIETPKAVFEHPLMQKVHELSDETKILILRALIYNPHLTQDFLNNDKWLMNAVDTLIHDNKKLNTQMAEPIDSRVRSCSGDTLIHCAARMGLRRLLVRLYNAGASDSLTLCNSHGYIPFDSVLNQMDRISADPKLTREEKVSKTFHLEKVRSTLNSLQYRKIIKNQDAIVEKLEIATDEHRELTDIVTSIPQQVISEGIGSGLITALGQAGKWAWKKIHPPKIDYISEDSAHNADIEKHNVSLEKSNIAKRFVILYGAPSPSVIDFMTKNSRLKSRADG